MEFSLKNIFGLVQSILPSGSFNKIGDKTTRMLEQAEGDIKGTIIPTLEDLLEHKDVLKALDKKPSAKLIKDGVKVKSVEDYVKRNLEYYKDIIKSMGRLEKDVKSTLSNATNEKTMSFKQLALYRYVEDIMSNTRFTLRSIYMIMRDDKDTVLPVKFSKDVLQGITDFRSKVFSKNNVTSDLDDIAELADDSVYGRYTGDVPDSIALDGAGSPGTIQGFMGNPIYTFRKWLVDRQADRRDDLVTSKNMIELRLMELRNEEAGNPDNEQLKKQINYYEEELASIDAKIAKIESVD